MLLSKSVEIRTIENCQPSADHASAFLHSLGRYSPLLPRRQSEVPNFAEGWKTDVEAELDWRAAGRRAKPLEL
jgi:hypothetical protein